MGTRIGLGAHPASSADSLLRALFIRRSGRHAKRPEWYAGDSYHPRALPMVERPLRRHVHPERAGGIGHTFYSQLARSPPRPQARMRHACATMHGMAPDMSNAFSCPNREILPNTRCARATCAWLNVFAVELTFGRATTARSHVRSITVCSWAHRRRRDSSHGHSTGPSHAGRRAIAPRPSSE